MAIKPPRIEREGIGQPATRAPRFISSDRGKWTTAPKARRTIAELTDIIKRVVQRTFFPLVRAYNITASAIHTYSMSAEIAVLRNDGVLTIVHPSGNDLDIHSMQHDIVEADDSIAISAHIAGWDTAADTAMPGALWCYKGPILLNNMIGIPRNKINEIAILDDTSGDYVLKATRMGSHDFKLEYDHGGKLVEIGQGGGGGQGAKVYRRENTPIPKNIHTKIQFDQEIYDTDGIHDNTTNNTRLTCVTSGKYLVTAHVIFAAVTLWDKQGHRQMRILKTDPNHVYPIATTRIPTEVLTPTTLNLTDIVSLNAGDFLEVEVHHTSNYSLNVLGYDALNDQSSSIFTMQRIS